MTVYDFNWLVNQMLSIFNQCFLWLYNIRIGPLSLLEFYLAFIVLSMFLAILSHVGFGPTNFEFENHERAKSSGNYNSQPYSPGPYLDSGHSVIRRG